ncbi:MAG: hypothetical protein M3P51_17730 [Chloroflexota bacterium]|nr:hypothetical protein [Chloroflexota bacterium]
MRREELMAARLSAWQQTAEARLAGPEEAPEHVEAAEWCRVRMRWIAFWRCICPSPCTQRLPCSAST